MPPSRRDALRAAVALPLVAGAAPAAEAPHADPRRGKLKTLNDDFPFDPPATAREWLARREQLRTQVRVALGLWPEPPKTPLDAVVHGKIERPGYTIEKVFFRSRPGVTVSGNLYRPADGKGPRPAVLFAHGHWNDGRFHVASQKAAEKDVASGAEADVAGARHFMQALPVSLARRGFVVFQYDMLGYADSTALVHRETFTDVQSQLWLHSVMGLQTWNSIRALDFVASLPDVDPAKVGITGASGGGTQSFLLAAVDDRLAAAFPAVMVSTSMQGGCVCENATYLRVGTGNCELASLFAPKPMAMSGADDWTKKLMTSGFPSMQKVWALLGKPDNVAAKVWAEYPHNFNRPAREFMASWFERHLMGHEFTGPEAAFEPVPPRELSVFDAERPRPKDELGGRELEAAMRAEEKARLADPAANTAAELRKRAAQTRAALRAVVGVAPLVAAARRLDGAPTAPPPEVEETERVAKPVDGGRTLDLSVVARRPGTAEVVPLRAIVNSTQEAVIWLHPAGAASLEMPEWRRAFPGNRTLVVPDLLGVGRAALAVPRPVDPKYAAFTFGYNRPLLLDRVRDALLAAAWARRVLGAQQLSVAGVGECGLVALLVRAVSADIGRTFVDVDQFRWGDLKDASDPRMLPGALRWGGVSGLLACCAPGRVRTANDPDAESDVSAALAYLDARERDALRRSAGPADAAALREWLAGGW